MALEDAAERGAADGQAVVVGKPVAVLGQRGVRRGVDLGDQQRFLLGRGSTATAGLGLGIERLALATQGPVARERAGTDAEGAGDLGIAQAGVMGAEQPVTEIAGVGGRHMLGLLPSVNTYETRSKRVFAKRSTLERTRPDGGARLTRKVYASDLADAQWALLAPHIPAAAPSGRPRRWPERELVDAIRYVARTGCPWRHLPEGYPPWETAYAYFRRWQRDRTWERLHDVLRCQVRVQAGRHPRTQRRHPGQSVGEDHGKGGRAATTVPRR